MEWRDICGKKSWERWMKQHQDPFLKAFVAALKSASDKDKVRLGVFSVCNMTSATSHLFKMFLHRLGSQNTLVNQTPLSLSIFQS